MRKKKGNLLQRTMALLLSVVLAAGMALDAYPLTALAQENAGGGYNAAEESVSGNTVTEEESGAEAGGEETGADSAVEQPGDGDTEEAGETKKPAESPVPEGQDGESGQKQQAAEDEEDTGSNDQQLDGTAAKRQVMGTADVAAQAGELVSGEGWMLDTDGKLTIETQNGIIKWADFNSMGTNAYVNDIKTVEIKSGVGSIHNYSFAGCSQLTGVTIPDSVTDIRSSAFWLCTSLTSIEIPDSVTVIGESVFEDCSSLESITGLGGVTKINKRAFANCTGLKEITLPAGLTQIGEIAFRECTNLESVIMQGDTPPTLSDPTDVFQRCYFVSNKVKGIKVPEGTAKVYKEAWTKWTDYITDGTDGTADEFLASGEGWTLDKDGKLTIASDTGMENWEGDENHSDNKKKIKTVELLDGVTFIKENAFFEARLTAITIPSSVTKIEAGAFWGCQSLTNITIPESVTSIGDAVFARCSSLESVTMLGETPAAIGEEVFGYCKFVTDNAKGIKVPEGTAAEYKAAWAGWQEYITDGTDGTEDELLASGTGWTLNKAGKLTIMSAVGCAGWVQWEDAYGQYVVSVEIEMNADDPVTGLDKEMFDMCVETMKSITIPDSVTSIDRATFQHCKVLESITIPDSVTNIGDYALSFCDSLKEVRLPSGMASIPEGMFMSSSSLTGITIPDDVTSIGAVAFSDCSGLADITIPDKVTSIGARAFYGCSLTDITIPAGVTSIGQTAFQDCSSLESVTMLGSTPPTLGVSSSGKTAHFDGCKFKNEGTKGIKVPSGSVDTYKTAWTEWAAYITDGTDDTEDELENWGEGWTLNKAGKLTIESATGMTDWENQGRGYYSEKVISVEIEMNNDAPITSIGEYAFVNCANITSVTIADSVESIGQRAFENCGNLTGIKLSNSLKSIEENTFQDCSKLTDITIPDSVTSIGGWAFWKCKALENITIPDSVTNIGDYVFYECDSLSEVTLPSGMASIQDGMFNGCSSLTGITIPDGVTSIGKWAFQDCSALAGITIPSGVTDIKWGAFSGCAGLTGITIPARVTSIGHMAFQKCEGLETVTMLGSTPPTLGVSSSGKTAHFEGCKFVTDNTKGIKVPAGSVDTYKAAWAEWADFISENSAPDTPADKDKVETAKKAVEKALADITVSNATTQESLQSDIEKAVQDALEAAGMDSKGVTVAVENFAKTEATTDAAGSITANIKITSGTETAEAAVDKTIDRLPGTPAGKVEAVKKAVEEALQKAIDKALAGKEVTNDNAEEVAEQIGVLIPEAVAGALEAAGVSTDEIEIGEVDIRIEPAADRDGSIKVTIPVTSREDAGASGSASVQVPVTKPGGEEEPDKEAEAAKKAVEEALKNITITNETTLEDILDALKKALGEDAAVEGIEELERVEATQDAPGRLRLKITLKVNGKTIYVTVDAAIAQPERKTGVYVRFTDYYDMDGSTPVYKYTGLAVRPAVEVYNNETLLTPGKDYTIGYKNNIKPGTAAALTVKGKGSFSGTSNAVNFTIINADIDRDTEHPTEMTVIANTKVTPVIMNGTKKLTAKDYRLEGEGLANGKYAAATAPGVPNLLTVKGAGSYEGSSFTINVTVIERSAAGKLAVKIDKNFKPVYDGKAIDLSSLFQQPQDGENAGTAAEPQDGAGTVTEPQEQTGAITVTDARDKTKILKEGTDFTVLCTSDLTRAGTVKFTLTGMGAYTGSVNKSFRISPLKVTDTSRFSVTFDEEKTYEYRAAGTEVDSLVVKYLGKTDADTDDQTLIPGVDYKVTYSNHKKVSGTKEAGLKVTFLGSYKGSSAVQKTFKIVPAKLSPANTAVTVPDKVYNRAGQAYKSVPIVTVDGVTIKASNYTVSYAWATASDADDDTKYVEDNRVKATIAEGDSWAKVKVKVTPKEAGSYGLAEGAVLEGAYYVRKKDNAVNLTKAKVTFFDKAGTQLRGLEYNGNTFYTPAGNNAEAESAPDGPNAVYVRVMVSGAVVDPSLYDVTWTNATAKGKATVVIRGTGEATEKGMAVGSKNQAVTIRAMALKGKTLKSYVENVAEAMNSLKDLFFKKR